MSDAQESNEDRRNLEEFHRAKQRMEENRQVQDDRGGSWAGTLAIAAVIVVVGAIFLLPHTRGPGGGGATRSSKLEREQRMLLIEQAERAAQDSTRSEGQPHVELTASEQP